MLLVFLNQVPYMQLSDMIPGVYIIHGKVSVVSINQAGGSGDPSWGVCFETAAGVLGGEAP